METRPFFKKLVGLFKRDPRPTVKSPAATVSEFPLSNTKPNIVKVRRRTQSVKGAYGKCRQRIDTSESNDPRFNHALRRFRRKQ